MTKQFRTAYVACASGHDFEELKLFCSHIRFVVSEEYRIDDLPTLVEKGLREFDNAQDVLVPVGRVAVNLVIGEVMGRWNQPFKIALYQDHTYVIHSMPSIREVAESALS